MTIEGHFNTTRSRGKDKPYWQNLFKCDDILMTQKFMSGFTVFIRERLKAKVSTRLSLSP